MQNLILNRYRPLETAGSGGFGTVVAAWDTRIQRRVAIKCLRLEGYVAASDPASVRDIPGLEEARTAAMLTDPAIVGVIDFEMCGPMAYLIMEYVDGATLTQLMAQEGAFSLDAATAVFDAVAHALQVAHENQVLHLDIKPDNVLINRQGQVKVADFGLAQLSHEAGFGKAAGGTIGYMPLEQMRLEAPDVRTDEWALAALTYEMLMGENPFRAPDLAAAEHAIEDAEVVIPSLARVDVDEEVDEALFGALAIGRDDRFDSVALFADAMMPHLGNAKRGAKELAGMVAEACFDGAGAQDSSGFPAEGACAQGEGAEGDMPEEDIGGAAGVRRHGCGVFGMRGRRNQEPAGAQVSGSGATHGVEPDGVLAARDQVAQGAPVAWEQDDRAFAAPDAARLHARAGSGRSLGSRLSAAVGHRVWAAAAATFAGYVAASNIDTLFTVAGRTTMEFWSVVAICGIAGAAFPAAGAAAGVLALAAAFGLSGAWPLAVVVAVAGTAWWGMCARHGKFAANVGATALAAGAAQAAGAVPLVCALFLRPKNAAVTAAFGVAVSFALACTGSLSLAGWNIFSVQGSFAALGEGANAWALLTNPGCWALAALWIAAAALGSAACGRGRAVAAFGTVVAGVMVVAGLCAQAYFTSGGVTWVPDVLPLVICVVSTTVATALAAKGVPYAMRLNEELAQSGFGRPVAGQYAPQAPEFYE